MRWAPIAIAILIVGGSGLTRPAHASPAMPPRDTMILEPSMALLPVRYHRHYFHRHYFHRPRLAHYSRHMPAADGIKPGEWQFTSELQAPAPVAGPQSSAPPSPQPQPQPPANNSAQTTYMACIASNSAVPAGLDPRCKLDGAQQQGSRVTWSMSCANTRVRSDGVAQYHGDTMDGTMVSHVPGAKGAAMDLTQHITGHYSGPCTQSAQNPAASPPNLAGGNLGDTGQPPAVSEGAAPQSAGGETPAAAPREQHVSRHVHHRRYVRYHYHRHRHWRWWF